MQCRDFMWGSFTWLKGKLEDVTLFILSYGKFFCCCCHWMTLLSTVFIWKCFFGGGEAASEYFCTRSTLNPNWKIRIVWLLSKDDWFNLGSCLWKYEPLNNLWLIKSLFQRYFLLKERNRMIKGKTNSGNRRNVWLPASLAAIDHSLAADGG